MCWCAVKQLLTHPLRLADCDLIMWPAFVVGYTGLKLTCVFWWHRCCVIHNSLTISSVSNGNNCTVIRYWFVCNSITVSAIVLNFLWLIGMPASPELRSINASTSLPHCAVALGRAEPHSPTADCPTTLSSNTNNGKLLYCWETEFHPSRKCLNTDNICLHGMKCNCQSIHSQDGTAPDSVNDVIFIPFSSPVFVTEVLGYTPLVYFQRS